MSRLPRLYTPEEIADSIRVSPWWLKDQARKRAIPAIKIAGAWRFTEQHYAQILRQHESAAIPAGVSASPRSTATELYAGDSAPVAVLTARTPRRRRASD
ncbi:helix-turn-helix domain-containing protein [Streptomyces sp. NPDC093111]|uniref:helix-turn-helix domain-containing protein n=1 Tax=Streptomyces sp. NPDC093111 TaxID=3154978 RepID=UPI00341CF571